MTRMPLFLFVSDLHGSAARYAALEREVLRLQPRALLLGGDLLPHFASIDPVEYVERDFAALFRRLRDRLQAAFPQVGLVLGNDDTRLAEAPLHRIEREEGLWVYLHRRRELLAGWPVFGYNCVPPTPFQLKDFERFDVSRYLDPGCLAPEEGLQTVEVPLHELRFGTIMADLEELVGEEDLQRAVLLMHSPPYRTALDRAGLDGQKIDLVPLELNVGSLAIRRLVEARQPQVGLHGHIHESPRLTGSWRDLLGRTHLFSAAHDGSELALVLFDPECPEQAERLLVPA